MNDTNGFIEADPLNPPKGPRGPLVLAALLLLLALLGVRFLRPVRGHMASASDSAAAPPPPIYFVVYSVLDRKVEQFVRQPNEDSDDAARVFLAMRDQLKPGQALGCIPHQVTAVMMHRTTPGNVYHADVIASLQVTEYALQDRALMLGVETCVHASPAASAYVSAIVQRMNAAVVHELEGLSDLTTMGRNAFMAVLDRVRERLQREHGITTITFTVPEGSFDGTNRAFEPPHQLLQSRPH